MIISNITYKSYAMCNIMMIWFSKTFQKMKILELGAQSNDTFNSMIENAECHGKRGIPGKR